MGIFRRRGRPEPDPEPTGTEPDAYLAPLSVAEAAHVAAIARDQLASMGVLCSEDFFGAARILVLADLVRRLYDRPIPRTGVLVAIPSRHLLQLHFPASTDTVLALNAMVQTAVGQFQNQPGPISPYVFHLGPDMVATQVSYLEGNTVSVRVEGAVEEMFRMIGLMDSGDQ